MYNCKREVYRCSECGEELTHEELGFYVDKSKGVSLDMMDLYCEGCYLIRMYS